MARSDHQLERFLAASFVCSVLSLSMGCATDGEFPFSAFGLPLSVVILSDPEEDPRFTVLAADGSSLAVAIDEQALRDRYPQLLSLVGLTPVRASSGPPAASVSIAPGFQVRGMRIVPFSGHR
jgi:hypothetical protein